MKRFFDPENKILPLNRKHIIVYLFAIVSIGMVWKAVFLSLGAFPFNSDEAITGLMARHILQGARPVFFYGQVYMGSLDAFLVAGLFRIFGESVLWIRVLQASLYSITIITTGMLGKSITGSWETGLLAALFLAIPSVNTTLYTTVSLGGYGEALVLANAAFLCGSILFNRVSVNGTLRTLDWVIICLLGAVTGLGFWVFGITLIATIPSVLFVFYAIYTKTKPKFGQWILVFAILLFFFILGSIAWWIASLQNGLLLSVSELTGSAVSVEAGSWIQRTASHVFNFVFLGLPAVFGLRPPWEVRWLMLPLIPFVLIGWGAAIGYFPRILKSAEKIERDGWGMLIASVFLLISGFLFTPFGLDPSGRYFLPLTVPLALMLARVITAAKIKVYQKRVLVLFLLIFHMGGTLQSSLRNPPGITTQFDAITWIDHSYDQELIRFLKENGETRGFSNYWVSYPLAFLSGEEIIFSPRLPYHPDLRYTTRDDRIPRYTKLIEEAGKIAYITTNNSSLDQKLEQEFVKLGVNWTEKAIGDYRVYHQLSKPVRPNEIGLGVTNPAIQGEE